MDTVLPTDIVSRMIAAGAAKAELGVSDLLIRGALSGALLGVATSLAFGAAVQTGQPLVGALIFPVGFVMIVLLGLELVTGSFALLPMAVIARRASLRGLLSNWIWVFIGNLLGSLLYGWLLAITLTNFWHTDPAGVALRIAQTSEIKTLGVAHFGVAGLVTVFVKAMLCNWLVCLGVVMGMSSTATFGRIAAAWLPIFVFFAQGFEHSVVNMFIIPTGMMLGAKTSLLDWWLWNQIPVTLGNIVGGLLFTGLALLATYAPRRPTSAASLRATAD